MVNSSVPISGLVAALAVLAAAPRSARGAPADFAAAASNAAASGARWDSLAHGGDHRTPEPPVWPKAYKVREGLQPEDRRSRAHLSRACGRGQRKRPHECVPTREYARPHL